MSQCKKIITGALLLLLAFSLAGLGRSLLTDARTKSQIRQMRQQFHSLPPYSAPALPSPPELNEIASNATPPVMLEKFRALYQQNPDIVGWITIDGTRIDYPVMQSRENPEFYLNHDFKRQTNKNGLPFLDKASSIEDMSPLIIHGHNMKSGLMFSDLTLYKEADYYRSHPVIRFDTLYEEREYEIAAVILAPALHEGDDGFRYYRTESITSSRAFNEYWQNIQALALYETNATACYGDNLIILSTCEYSQQNGRLAVIARKVTQTGQS